LATLTLTDVERIERVSGVPRQRFVEAEWLSEAEARRYAQRRPLYAHYFRHGAQRLTLKRFAQACVFFAAGQGCILDPASRPTACLLYPFDVSTARELRLQVDRFPSLEEARLAEGTACLAVQEADGWEGLAARFNTTPAKVLELSVRLEEEVRDHVRALAPGRGRQR
jgi:hypothetical protein